MSQANPTNQIDLTREPKQPEKSVPELLSEMTSELSTLMRKEVELARVETKEEVGRAGKAAGMLGAAGFAGYMTLLFASLALAWLLNEVMPTALAFFLVAVVYAIVGGLLYAKGRQRMKNVNPVPEQTVETLKEDVQWAKAQKS